MIDRRLVFSLLLGLGLAACAGRAEVAPPVAAPSPPPPPAALPADVHHSPTVLRSSASALRRELSQLFLDASFEHATWGVMIQSLATGEILYELNASKLLMPASAMKVVTVATAAEHLGWDFRYETKLTTTAPIRNGVLEGDLVVVGTGDPTIGPQPDGRVAAFDSLVDGLRVAGVRRIEGRLVGDDNALPDTHLGRGWAWDDLSLSYASPIGALQFDANGTTITITAGASVGAAVTATAASAASDLTVQSEAMTLPADVPARLVFARLPGTATLVVRGGVPVGTAPFSRRMSVHNPTLHFLRAFEAALREEGIEVAGGIADIDDVAAAAGAVMPATTLGSYQSPPFRDIAAAILEPSQNQYAETVFQTIEERIGGEHGQAVTKLLADWGVLPLDVVVADGSGLSRYNAVTARALVTILRHLNRDERHREPFLEALPVAGVDGTMARRLTDTKAERNARAKTGSLSNVRTLAGFVATDDGEPLVFAILANNYNLPSAAIEATIDLAVERLANFSRAGSDR